MRKIAVLNQKGGVGKTTTVANTAAGLARLGKKVAVIDMDPQAHLTLHFGVDPREVESGSYKILCQQSSIDQELIKVRDNLSLISASVDMAGAETELVNVVGRERILKEAIEQSQGDFDYLFVDCAPSLGLLTLNSLAAVEEIIIPLEAHFLALQGLGRLLETVDLVNKRINPKLKVRWILMCMYDTRTSLSGEVRADIQEFLNNARGTQTAWANAEIFPIYIRRNIKLAEAPSYGQTIFEYEPDCNGAQDYANVARIINSKSPQTDSQPASPETNPKPQPQHIQNQQESQKPLENKQTAKQQYENDQTEQNENQHPETEQSEQTQNQQDQAQNSNNPYQHYQPGTFDE